MFSFVVESVRGECVGFPKDCLPLLCKEGALWLLILFLSYSVSCFVREVSVKIATSWGKSYFTVKTKKNIKQLSHNYAFGKGITMLQFKALPTALYNGNNNKWINR